MIVEKISNTGLMEVPFLPLTKNACNTFNIFVPKLFTRLLTNMKVKNPGKCPIPPVSRGHFLFYIKKRNLKIITN